MKINFEYNKEKDVWCLLTKGKSSNNSSSPTKVYEELVAEYGENPTSEETAVFIGKYIAEKQIDIQKLTEEFKDDWETIAGEYHKIAEKVFGLNLPQEPTAYLTINTRCPYSIEGNYFFVSVSNQSARSTVMHELWHFYTWQKFGADVEERLGKQKYNDIKEAFTVLLNIECGDLFHQGAKDYGYPQHQDLRSKIVETWNESKDIEKVWLVAEQF